MRVLPASVSMFHSSLCPLCARGGTPGFLMLSHPQGANAGLRLKHTIYVMSLVLRGWGNGTWRHLVRAGEAFCPRRRKPAEGEVSEVDPQRETATGSLLWF